MRLLLKILRHLWALPATLIGLLFVIPALCGGAKARFRGGILEVSGGKIIRMLSFFSFAAITFGHIIMSIDSRQIESLRSHELVHVRQYERWGIFFFPLYFLSSLFQLLRRRRPYFDNMFEREAYGKSEDHRA